VNEKDWREKKSEKDTECEAKGKSCVNRQCKKAKKASDGGAAGRAHWKQSSPAVKSDGLKKRQNHQKEGATKKKRKAGRIGQYGRNKTSREGMRKGGPQRFHWGWQGGKTHRAREDFKEESTVL